MSCILLLAIKPPNVKDENLNKVLKVMWTALSCRFAACSIKSCCMSIIPWRCRPVQSATRRSQPALMLSQLRSSQAVLTGFTEKPSLSHDVAKVVLKQVRKCVEASQDVCAETRQKVCACLSPSPETAHVQ